MNRLVDSASGRGPAGASEAPGRMPRARAVAGVPAPIGGPTGARIPPAGEPAPDGLIVRLVVWVLTVCLRVRDLGSCSPEQAATELLRGPENVCPHCGKPQDS